MAAWFPSGASSAKRPGGDRAAAEVLLRAGGRKMGSQQSAEGGRGGEWKAPAAFMGSSGIPELICPGHDKGLALWPELWIKKVLLRHPIVASPRTWPAWLCSPLLCRPSSHMSFSCQLGAFTLRQLVREWAQPSVRARIRMSLFGLASLLAC